MSHSFKEKGRQDPRLSVSQCASLTKHRLHPKSTPRLSQSPHHWWLQLRRLRPRRRVVRPWQQKQETHRLRSVAVGKIGSQEHFALSECLNTSHALRGVPYPNSDIVQGRRNGRSLNEIQCHNGSLSLVACPHVCRSNAIILNNIDVESGDSEVTNPSRVVLLMSCNIRCDVLYGFTTGPV